ncbi:MAG: PEP-CTERM sorting domain-containing protein [Geminicoccaceae bacterium]
MKSAALSCLCGLGLIAAAQTASAALITSVDRATFQASITAATIDVQDFDGLATDSVLVTDGDVTYITSGGVGFITDDFTTSTPPNSLGSTSTLSFILGSGGEQATFDFVNPITAFAIDIITSAAGDGAYQANISTGDNLDSIAQVFPGGLTGQFIGFTSDTPFTAVTITALTGFDYTLDTLVFGDASALDSGGGPTDVPEPSALLLLSGGLIGIALVRRRRQRRTTNA